MPKRVAFIHPDLGIGGAEQLVISLALALKSKGYEVKIYTPYHDPDHCFPETKDGQLTVEVRGHWFPRSILGRGVALCAYIRMLLATLFVVMYGGWFDVIIVDQVSAVLPILKLSQAKSVFYCHYPDKLLSTDRRGLLKRLYRVPLDWLEGFGLKTADDVLVNSEFTKTTVERAFSLPATNNLQVLYPSVNTDIPTLQSPPSALALQPYFLSLNRYERKKNIALAIQAYALAKPRARLFIAGGFDPRLDENVQHFDELVTLAKSLSLLTDTPNTLETARPEAQVVFLRNVAEAEKSSLIHYSIAVLYTPSNEHFGIVPLEAMVRETPVLASNSGGPKETVVDGESGFLLSEDPVQWSKAMTTLVQEPERARSMGVWARSRVVKTFSFASMAERLQKVVG